MYGGGRWGIFNEDTSTNIPVGASFNVLVVPHANADVFLQIATAGNTSGDSTSINSTATNGKPKAFLQVTQRSTGGSRRGCSFDIHYSPGMPYVHKDKDKDRNRRFVRGQ